MVITESRWRSECWEACPDVKSRSREQKAKGFADFALDYRNPDFVKYAESYGAVGMKVGKDDSLSELLRKAFSLNTVVLIECPIDYSVNYETFSKELSNIVCDI